jgi:hypoxanthine phosphoribosyltransferase
MKIHDDTQPTLHSSLLATDTEVNAKISTIAAQIIDTFHGTNPLFVCLLRGGMPFATQLMFAITEQDPYFFPELDYMTVSRYGKSLTASTPRVVMDLSHKSDITDRPVIILDDMIDKGGTYSFTKNHLEQKGARSVYLAVLVQRELKVPREFDADFYGFSIQSEEWLVGMGLDDARLGVEANRWAKYIAIANPSD